MTRNEVADRLVSYSDAVVAFALVNSLAFLIALTERDVRCSLVEMQTTVWVAITMFPTVLTAALVACRLAELRLRSDALEQELDAARALGYFQIARITIVWLTICACAPLIRMALSDNSCRIAAA